MAAATIQAVVYHGSAGSPTIASAESGVTFNRSDDELTTSRVPVPSNIPGTNYSNYKQFRLQVTAAGTTTISNFGYRRASSPASGLALFALLAAVASYVQCTGAAGVPGNRPADSTAALAASPAPNTPAGYTEVVGSITSFDADSYATTSTGYKGNLLQIVVGLSHLYAGGPDPAAVVPDLVIQYDEA